MFGAGAEGRTAIPGAEDWRTMGGPHVTTILQRAWDAS